MGRKNTGYFAFTLVELMIVVAILAILIVLAVAYFRGQTFKANDARRKGDLDRIKIAIEEYEKDHNCYPPKSLVKCDPGTGLQPYLDKIPCDPVTKTDYVYDYDTSKVCPDWFRLYANLQNPNDLVGSGYTTPAGDAVYCLSSPNALDCKYVTKGTYFGCKNYTCVPLLFDNSVGTWECANRFSSSDCNSQCSNINSQCKSTSK